MSASLSRLSLFYVMTWMLLGPAAAALDEPLSAPS
jgi:hypothetical protein